MKKMMFYLGFIALVLSSCANSYRDTSLYQLSGRQKAIVSVLPVINHAGPNDLCWDLSREFTDEIRKRIYESPTLYLLREGGSIEVAKLLSTPNPNSISASVFESLGTAEYVVVSEIIKQEEQPYGLEKEVDSSSIALRVRVLDIRNSTPKIILQEVLNQEFAVTQPCQNCDYEKVCWGTEAFRHTPMGMAHNRLVKELVTRTEAYIEASR